MLKVLNNRLKRLEGVRTATCGFVTLMPDDSLPEGEDPDRLFVVRLHPAYKQAPREAAEALCLTEGPPHTLQEPK